MTIKVTFKLGSSLILFHLLHFTVILSLPIHLPILIYLVITKKMLLGPLTNIVSHKWCPFYTSHITHPLHRLHEPDLTSTYNFSTANTYIKKSNLVIQLLFPLKCIMKKAYNPRCAIQSTYPYTTLTL